jgi:hypothetical protein
MAGYYLDDLCEITVGEGILEVNIFGRQFEEEQVDQVISKVEEMAGEKQFLVLTIVDPEARVNFWGLRKLSGTSAMKYARAKAYVIHSTRHQLMAEVFFKLYRPSRPIKVFNDREAARKWLSAFET